VRRVDWFRSLRLLQRWPFKGSNVPGRSKRYAGLEGYDIESCAAKVKADYGKVCFSSRVQPGILQVGRTRAKTREPRRDYSRSGQQLNRGECDSG
jgi:hypothetical protein